jgi:hypothetical protein
MAKKVTFLMTQLQYDADSDDIITDPMIGGQTMVGG